MLLLSDVSQQGFGVIQIPCDVDEVIGQSPDIVSVVDLQYASGGIKRELMKNIGNDNKYILIYLGVIVTESRGCGY